MEKIYLLFIMNFPIMITMIMIFLMMKNSKFSPMKFLLFIMSFMLMMNLYSIMFVNSIYLLIIMLMYISGLMTLFAYFISLMNKKMFSKHKATKLVILWPLIMLILANNFQNSKHPHKLNFNASNLKLFKIYISNHLAYLILIFILLILILIISIKICKNNKGTLRQKKDE